MLTVLMLATMLVALLATLSFATTEPNNNFEPSTGPPKTMSLPITDAVELFFGELVGVLLATGRAQKLTDIAALHVLGHVVGFVNPISDSQGDRATGNTAGTVRVIIQIDTRTSMQDVTGLGAATDGGDLVYATDGDTFTLTPTVTLPAVGEVFEFRSGSEGIILWFSHENIRNV